MNAKNNPNMTHTSQIFQIKPAMFEFIIFSYHEKVPIPSSYFFLLRADLAVS